MVYLVHFEKIPTKHSRLKKDYKCEKMRGFGKKLKGSGKKLKRFWKKTTSSFMTSKLNEPVVTNYSLLYNH